MIIINEKNPNPAIALLKAGGVIICPAFTIYGFSAFLFSKAANKRIFLLKRRSINKPFIVIAHKDFILDVAFEADKDKLAFLLDNGFSVLIKTKIKLPHWASFSSKTVFRLANTEFLKKVCSVGPITSTSVNISNSGEINSPLQIVKLYKNRVNGIVLGKVKGVGSTIVELNRGVITVLRRGFNIEKLEVIGG
ncbi:L-threonylcarbamoyladenylate synthase [Hippea maritima]|uniref:L-threonylcarbamoyladenylate synthase n=1 Tax=Hippea maritima (strain ATCC 700847 / DSM 10411 / MH2) TaxID=760142 RepID=F2LWA9_HIPMA|nr:Sua5/YciO/YrdC/YwlC family protein [Hippea maritima]AEA34043.1 SUA5/yciO/yrdC domain protein [Hippea maritima DSM 10411]